MKKLLLTCAATLLAMPMLYADDIYLLGQPVGNWTEPVQANASIFADYKLTESETNVYTGSFEIATGSFNIRFTNGLGGWDGTQYGARQNDGDNLDITLTGGTYSGNYVNGKGNWSCPTWPGGKLGVKLDLNNQSVTFTAESITEASDVLYLPGMDGNWGDWNAMKTLSKVSTTDGSNVYEGSFDIPGNSVSFKITSEQGWDGYNLGLSNENGCQVYNNLSYSTILSNGGNSKNIEITNWTGGTLKISVCLDDLSLTLTGPDQPEKVYDITKLYVVGEPNGWNIANSDIVLEPETGNSNIFSTTTYIAAEKFSFRFYSQLGNWDNNIISAPLNSDSNYNIQFNDKGVYEGSFMLNGKGKWNIEEWEGGDVTLTVDLSNGTVTFVDEEQGTTIIPMYVVGFDINGEDGWNSNNPMIYNEADGTYTWEGTSLGSGFKFTDDPSWQGQYNIGAGQGNIALDTPYTYYNGGDSGNINFENDADVVENPKLTLNLEEGTVLLTGTIKQQPITSYHLVGTLNDWTTSNYDYELLPVDGKEGVFSGSWTVPANPESSDLKFKLIAFDGYSVQFGSTGNTFALYGNTKTTISLVSGGDSQDIWCTNWEGGKMSMTLNTLTNQLEIEAPDQPESTPDFLWLVGNFNDWDLSNQEYKLAPVEGQKGAYSGSFSIPTQENLNEDGTLDNNFLKVKIAAGIDDDWSQVYGAGNFALYSNQPYESKMLVTNENFVITNWETGTLTVTVNWDEKEVTFESATQPELTNINTLYLIGAPQGWDINDDSMALTASKDGVFEGTFTIPAGEFEFLFYTELGNWEANYVGANSTSNMELPLTDNVLDYFGDVAFTKSNWKVSGWNGGQVNIMVNLNEMQVSFAGKTTGVDAIFGENGFSYANGIVTVAGASEITVYNVSGQAVARVNGETADLNNLSSGIYVVVAPGLNPVKIVK